MDMPDNCMECPIGENMSIPLETCIRCPIAQKCMLDEEPKTRPKVCPLKPIPEKMEICGTYNGEYYAKGGKMPSWKSGWNACIDEILKGEEHE